MPTRESKLETALKELVGFAERNEKRARQAYDSATSASRFIGGDDAMEDARIERIEAEARHHEAQRVYFVIRDRVKEALS